MLHTQEILCPYCQGKDLQKMAATLQGFNNGLVNPAKSIFNWRINILRGKAALKKK
jgi:hypothetical protein